MKNLVTIALTVSLAPVPLGAFAQPVGVQDKVMITPQACKDQALMLASKLPFDMHDYAEKHGGSSKGAIFTYPMEDKGRGENFAVCVRNQVFDITTPFYLSWMESKQTETGTVWKYNITPNHHLN